MGTTLIQNVMENILTIEVSKDLIAINFSNNFKCELRNSTNHHCSEKRPCFSRGCRVSMGDAGRIFELVKEVKNIKEPFTLIPDWISRITRNGIGWEVLKG